jgi:hypothetical protein
VDPIPDPLLLRKSGSAGNGTRASGSLARSSDHYTTEWCITHRITGFVDFVHRPEFQIPTMDKVHESSDSVKVDSALLTFILRRGCGFEYRHFLSGLRFLRGSFSVFWDVAP